MATKSSTPAGCNPNSRNAGRLARSTSGGTARSSPDDGEGIERTETMTTVIGNIGRRAGDDNIEALFTKLATYPLDRTFKRYGNFVYPAEALNGGWVYDIENGTAFAGNFFTYSCAFHLVTDEPDLIERLT